jgi:hypothetical protein
MVAHVEALAAGEAGENVLGFVISWPASPALLPGARPASTPLVEEPMLN